MLHVPHGPRQITKLRRVCVPFPLARAVDLVKGRSARVSVSAEAPELLLRSARAARAGIPVRDPHRARKITATGQVTLPAELMNQVQLRTEQWVYFALAADQQAVRVMSAAAMGPTGRTGR